LIAIFFGNIPLQYYILLFRLSQGSVATLLGEVSEVLTITCIVHR